MATSARGTDRRAGVVTEEVEQTCVVRAAQMCVVLRLRSWKEVFMSMLGALSEVWVGGRRGAGFGSEEHLRTTGPGPHTTLDLTHVETL